MTFQKGHKGFAPKASAPPAAKAAEAEPRSDNTLSEVKTVLGHLTTVVTALSDEMKANSARLAAVESGTARFLPMEHEGRAQVIVDVNPKAMKSVQPYAGTQEFLSGALLERPAVRGNLPVGSNGLELSDDFILRYPPAFRSGARVRINPDALVQGSVYKTRREEYAAAGIAVETVGEVLRQQRFSGPHRSYKYSVRFPGITRAHGNGYYETELLPA